jgi:F-type H+-transporting ATPase subunit delta
LFELARDGGTADEIGKDLAGIAEVLRTNPTFEAFLRDPGIGQVERTRVIDQVLKPKVSPLLANFLGVLNAHGRLGLLGQIASAYGDLQDEASGKIEVDVTTAQKLSSDELEQVRTKVSAALKKDAVIHQYVDESIIGGLVLRVEDKLIDASVRTQLETMKRQLMAARPR